MQEIVLDTHQHDRADGPRRRLVSATQRRAGGVLPADLASAWGMAPGSDDSPPPTPWSALHPAACPAMSGTHPFATTSVRPVGSLRAFAARGSSMWWVALR